ncbi:FAD-binding oxidoreductase [Alsobacter sp. SYSU M60028]|uniref:FAD-binding oxidoreductase n=1 Tax=Alsobacter ponti TaxID=2962936 RepID=A0ABT1L8X6_9HYPH|nr:FAD-binding oxidoreductase [Alsobacter ponti]MCP8937950.1 FAD-binding oxidoreductase [Alsobacter ponti]
MNAAVQELLATLGPDLVKVGDDIPQRNWADQVGLEPQRPLALLLPRSTDDVSKALAICHRHRQPVVTQGGMTGLAGGAHPGEGEVALSLERMNGIEEVDAASGTLTALAGTPLYLIQRAAEEAGLMCGIDLGARGSCTIGGNVSTNAGGNQVLRYGMARKNVLGLEVVLSDGRVVRSLNKMMKNNAGYDWTQMFIGSEGTLGVVTRVVLSLHARPRNIQTAVLAVKDVSDAIKVLRAAEKALPGGLLVFEAMWSEFYGIATTTIGVPAPIERGHDLYLLVEAPTGDAGPEAFENFLGEMYEAGLVRDAVVAKSRAERDKLWALRESVYEYGKHLPKQIGFDVSIPLNRMPEAVAALRRDMPNAVDGVIWVVFGHVADSNLHINAMPPRYTPEAKLKIEKLVYDLTASLGGSVSAEHGIGRMKKPYLSMTRTGPELALMATVKQALDPLGILNPGRVL